MLVQAIFVHTASVLGFIGIHFHFPDLNPFDWLRNWLKDLYNSLGGFFEKDYFQPLKLPPGAYQSVVIGESQGLVAYLWNAMLLIMLVIALVWRPAVTKLVRYIITGVVLALAFPYTLEIVSKLQDVGAALCSIVYYKPHENGPDSSLLHLPQIHNNLGLILALMGLISVGFFLWLVDLLYIPLTFVSEIMIPPTAFLAALMGLFDRMLSWLISMLLVATVFGPFATVGWVSLGSYLDDNVPSIRDRGLDGAMVFGSLLMALITNIALLLVAHYGVSKVSGKVKAFVKGQVTALQKKQNESRTNNPHRSYQNAMRPVTVNNHMTLTGDPYHSEAQSRVMSESARAIHRLIKRSGSKV